jgi:hypothetical protein
MSKEAVKVSLTEFMNFVNKSGSSKVTVVQKAKSKRDEEYAHFKDYWLKLRDKIKSVHKSQGTHGDLKELLNEVSDDKVENYRVAIDGYCAFWKRSKIEWCEPPRKTWSVGDVKIEINPELGVVMKDKVYVIKLFTNANDLLDKRHADLILTLMEQELRAKVKEEVVFAVLDVKRAKLFNNQNLDPVLVGLLQGEAKSFETIWKSIK